MTETRADDMIERLAHIYVDCGDGSKMQLRFILELGFAEASKQDDMQDELSRSEALLVAYRAIGSILEYLAQPTTREDHHD